MIRHLALALALAFAAAAFLACCSLTPALAHEIKFGALVIHHPWAKPAPAAAKVAAGYMRITNTGPADDRLVGIAAAISASAEIHDMRMEGEVMKMQALPEGLAIPAGQTVVLKPGSLHVMFMGLTRPVVEGEGFQATLTFEKAGSVTVDVEVAAPGSAMDHDE